MVIPGVPEGDPQGQRGKEKIFPLWAGRGYSGMIPPWGYSHSQLPLGTVASPVGR